MAAIGLGGCGTWLYHCYIASQRRITSAYKELKHDAQEGLLNRALLNNLTTRIAKLSCIDHLPLVVASLASKTQATEEDYIKLRSALHNKAQAMALNLLAPLFHSETTLENLTDIVHTISSHLNKQLTTCTSLNSFISTKLELETLLQAIHQHIDTNIAQRLPKLTSPLLQSVTLNTGRYDQIISAADTYSTLSLRIKDLVYYTLPKLKQKAACTRSAMREALAVFGQGYQKSHKVLSAFYTDYRSVFKCSVEEIRKLIAKKEELRQRQEIILSTEDGAKKSESQAFTLGSLIKEYLEVDWKKTGLIGYTEDPWANIQADHIRWLPVPLEKSKLPTASVKKALQGLSTNLPEKFVITPMKIKKDNPAESMILWESDNKGYWSLKDDHEFVSLKGWAVKALYDKTNKSFKTVVFAKYK
jgi:hypothetical protein